VKPFNSSVFLGASRRDGVFGLEFEAQMDAELCKPLQRDVLDRVSRHPRLLALQDHAQRELVAALAQRLTAREDDEDGRGLFDDVAALIRYLRARKWDLQAAEAMIRGTARWRHEFRFADLKAGAFKDTVALENATGKLYARGYDRHGRPVFYMKPRLENTFSPVGVVVHLVYCMERAVSCVDRREAEALERGDWTDDASAGPVGKIALLVDFDGYSLSNAIPLRTASEVMTILQDHYPERLGQAFFLSPPWIFSSLWSVVSPLVDPVTYAKIQFVSEVGEARAKRLEATFDLAALEKDFGGGDVRPFDSRVFLETERNGSAFGLEFNEQLAIAGSDAPHDMRAMQSLAAPQALSPRSGPAQEYFWVVSLDRRVLALPKEKRAAVRAVARALSSAPGLGEPVGLFDDAGAVIRNLRARHWDPQQAEGMLRCTAKWRESFQFALQREGVYHNVISHENETGIMYVRGFDLRGRPIVYVRPRNHNSDNHDGFLRHVVYVIERACACSDLREGVAWARGSAAEVHRSNGELMLLVDFAGWSLQRRPALRTLRSAVRLLQDHYPSRLGQAILFQTPPVLSALWALLWPLVDHETREKIVFARPGAKWNAFISESFDARTLERCVGGESDAPFDSEVFMCRSVDGRIYGAEFDAQLATLHAPAPCSPDACNGVGEATSGNEGPSVLSLWGLLGNF